MICIMERLDRYAFFGFAAAALLAAAVSVLVIVWADNAPAERIGGDEAMGLAFTALGVGGLLTLLLLAGACVAGVVAVARGTLAWGWLLPLAVPLLAAVVWWASAG